jgi:putative oxidoreductase
LIIITESQEASVLAAEDVGILFIRVVTGTFFAAHGCQMMLGWFGGRGIRQVSANFHKRGYRPALPFAIAAAGTELCAGCGVAFGLLWPLPAVALIGPMTVAVVSVHWPKIWVTENGIEYPLVLGFVMAGIALLPVGSVSLDNAFGIKLPLPPSYLVALAGTLAITAIALITSNVVTRRARAASATG